MLLKSKDCPVRESDSDLGHSEDSMTAGAQRDDGKEDQGKSLFGKERVHKYQYIIVICLSWIIYNF